MSHITSLLNNKVLAFNIFHVGFSIIILIASLKTIVNAIDTSNWALLVLASAEVLAVIFFVFPKFTKGAGIALILIFLLAIIISLIVGVVFDQLHLIIYFLCTYFIVVHGNILKINQ